MSGELNEPNDDSDSQGSAEGLSPELEEALREATESVDANRAKTESEASGESLNVDQMTIEALSNELANVKKEYEERLSELEELKDRSLRQQAEFENFRRRGLKERQETFKFGHQNLVKDLLPAVDNLERALEHAEGSGSGNLEGLLQGVDLVLREFLAALSKHSVTPVETQDQTFDPAIHEAVGQVPDATVPPNTVAQVLQKGYQLHDRMLRPARVMVTRAPTEDEAADLQGEVEAQAGEDEAKEE